MKWYSNTSKDRLKRYKEEMKVREEIGRMQKISKSLQWVEQASKDAKVVR